jgi:hypothetical protein
MGFFSELCNDLIRVKESLKQVDSSRLPDSKREEHNLIFMTILSMLEQPDLWEESCKFNIQSQGRWFRISLRNQNFASEATQDSGIYARFVAFLVELDLSLGFNGLTDSVKNNELREAWEKVKQKVFSKDDGVYYAFYQQPISILNFYMNNTGFKTFFDFEKKSTELKHTITTQKLDINQSISFYWKELKSKESEVTKLKDKLDEYKTAFNFVGLSQGFESLLQQKNEAKTKTFWLLSGLAIVTILPLGFKFMANVDSWQSMLSVIGLEFVLIYFFRVVLNHYHSLQTQIMQLELRQSLCQFIQSYAEYAKKIKTDDKDALEKFENLIFSSILSNPDKVPGTFDGVEGLTSLLKELKK